MVGRQAWWYTIFLGIVLFIGLLNVQNILQKREEVPCSQKREIRHSEEQVGGEITLPRKYSSLSRPVTSFPGDHHESNKGVTALVKGVVVKTAAIPGTAAAANGPLPVVNMPLVTEMKSTKQRWDWPETISLIPLCKKKYTNLPKLPDVSVIISYHENENLSNVLRTVHSIFSRTPSHLLREVIMVDDNSDKEDLKVVLPLYAKAVFGSKIQHFRSNVSLGLIKARLTGIKLAKAQVVIVMDSHLEVQPLWLEPLLYEIHTNKSTLAASYLDYMEKRGQHWEYVHSAASWVTYFDWSFVFGFQSMNKHEVIRRIDPTQPVKCAVTVGTLWAMDREFFFEIGALDEGMEKWGGENLDLAVRTWLFNGRVVNVPCSRVAHLESAHSRDYRRGWEADIHRNYQRFAEVWLDDYRRYFYRNFPHVQKWEPTGLEERFKIKQKSPHDFKWYLMNVFPELGLPEEDSFAWGGVTNLGLMMCLQAMVMMAPVMIGCSDLGTDQDLYWSQEGNLRLPMHVVQAEKHHNAEGLSFTTTEWTYYYDTDTATKYLHVQDGPLIERTTGQCLEPYKVILQGRLSYHVSLKQCDKNNPYQRWRFEHYTEAYSDFIRQLSTKRTFKKMDSVIQSIVTEFDLLNWSKYVPTAPPIGKVGKKQVVL